MVAVEKKISAGAGPQDAYSSGSAKLLYMFLGETLESAISLMWRWRVGKEFENSSRVIADVGEIVTFLSKSQRANAPLPWL